MSDTDAVNIVTTAPITASSVPAPRVSATMMGLGSILIWSSSIAFGRIMIESFGMVTGPLWVYLGGGVLLLSIMAMKRGELAKLKKIGTAYWISCGGMYIIYALSLNFAVGLSTSRRQVLAIAIINYLWPALTLLFAVPILKKKTSIWLLPGVIVAVAGVVMSVMAQSGNSGMTISDIIAGIRTDAMPYVMGMIAAVSWALYSGFSSRYGRDSDGNGVPVFAVASGLVFLMIRPFVSETPIWTLKATLSLVYMTIVVNLMAYMFWDHAMRKGDTILVMSASFFTPVLATFVICFVLGIEPGWIIWLSSALVTAGAIISKLSIRDGAPKPPIPSEPSES